MNILLTSSSFNETPGNHHKVLKKSFKNIDYLKGPLTENQLIAIIKKYDGIICGDDHYTEKVLTLGAKSRLKVLSKYGIGLDKIDLKAAKANKIKVLNTPGVNHITVAEHIIALILTYLKNIHIENNLTKNGEWKRITGLELYKKNVGILGLGRIGKELSKRLISFGVKIKTYDLNVDSNFIKNNKIEFCSSVEELVKEIDILILTIPLNEKTRGLINKKTIGFTKRKLIIVNTSRADIIDQRDLIEMLEKNLIKSYLTDVMSVEPMEKDNILRTFSNVIITPHIGSRTFESVERQGEAAVKNLIENI